VIGFRWAAFGAALELAQHLAMSLALVAIDRMASISWHAICTDARIEAVRLNKLLGRVVTTIAQRLELAQAKLVVITTMRNDVIDNSRRLQPSLALALFTQRLQHQLVFASMLPVGQIIPR